LGDGAIPVGARALRLAPFLPSRFAMRVLFDHQTFCAQRFGGVPRYFAELADHLARRPSVGVTVAAPWHVSGYLSGSRSMRIVGSSAPGWLARGSVAARRARLLVGTAASYVLARTGKYDIVHETGYNHPLRWPARSRVVTTIHDMLFELFPETFGDIGPLLSAQKRRAAERADHVICVSHQTRADLIRCFGVPESKTSVVHHGVTLPRMPAEAEPNIKVPYLLYIGARNGYKTFEGLLHALRASRYANDIHIVCVGGGPLTSAELALAGECMRYPDRLMQKNADDDELGWLYSKATAFVYPSLYEGFGMPILEAMALGCPVVACAAGPASEVAGDAAELVDWTGPESLATGLDHVLGSENTRSAMVARGHERARAFSWTRCAAETQAVYERL
jgi:glycosyltransferase involved in cell wall biosynthesis